MEDFNPEIHEKIQGGFQLKSDGVEVFRDITLKAFRMRLTQTEKRNLKLSDNLDVQIMADDLAASTFIGLDDPDLKAGLLALGALNMLELEGDQTVEQRITEILQNGTQDEAA